MSTIKIELDTRDQRVLAIVGNALLEIAGVSNELPEELPAILQEQNPIESESEPEPEPESEPEPKVKQGTALDESIPEVDADGYPWDKRIHSTAHSRNANGTWKVLRRPKVFGDDDEKWKGFIERTRAELRGEDPDTPQIDPAEAFGGNGVGQATENPEPTLTQEETQALADVANDNKIETVDFASLMKYVTSHKDEIGDFNKIGEICGKYGLANLAALQQDDTMLTDVFSDIVVLVSGAQ